MISIATKISAFLDPRDRIHTLLLLIPMLGVALLEMASIAMILPLVQVLVGAKGNAPSFLNSLWIFSFFKRHLQLLLLLALVHHL